MAVVVIFRSGTESCAIERALVQHIAPVPALSRPPLTPPALAGFLNLAGKALPVVRAERLFGGADTSDDNIYRHVLILNLGGEQIGLLVDRVLDVRDVDLDALREVSGDVSVNGSVVGDLSLDDGIVHLLSGDRLLMAAEKVQIEQLRAAEQARLDAWSPS